MLSADLRRTLESRHEGLAIQYLIPSSPSFALLLGVGIAPEMQPDWICLLLQRDRDARRAWQLLKAVQTSGWGGSSAKPKPVKGQLQNPEKVGAVLRDPVQ